MKSPSISITNTNLRLLNKKDFLNDLYSSFSKTYSTHDLDSVLHYFSNIFSFTADKMFWIKTDQIFSFLLNLLLTFVQQINYSVAHRCSSWHKHWLTEYLTAEEPCHHLDNKESKTSVLLSQNAVNHTGVCWNLNRLKVLYTAHAYNK